MGTTTKNISKAQLVELWDKFRGGDENALSAIYLHTSKPLYNYGMKFVVNDGFVEDCIQDLFLKLFSSKKSLSSATNPLSYLFYALKNIIIDNLNKANKISYSSLDALPFLAEYEYSLDDIETDNKEEIIAKFESVIKLLSDRQKEAIYLRFHKEMDYEEISLILNINNQSARNLVHRSIEKIREHMDISLFLSLLTGLIN